MKPRVVWLLVIAWVAVVSLGSTFVISSGTASDARVTRSGK